MKKRIRLLKQGVFGSNTYLDLHRLPIPHGVTCIFITKLLGWTCKLLGILKKQALGVQWGNR